MAQRHVVFFLKREESPPLSLGTEDSLVTARIWPTDSDCLALIHDDPLHL